MVLLLIQLGITCDLVGYSQNSVVVFRLALMILVKLMSLLQLSIVAMDGLMP